MENDVTPTDALQINRCSSDFGYLVDQGRALDCAELFTRDAKLIFGPGSPKPGTLEGLEAIRGFLASRQAQTHVLTRHVATNFRYQMLGSGAVEVKSLLTVYRSDDEGRLPSVSIVADVSERFQREAGGAWKIAERETTPVFIKA